MFTRLPDLAGRRLEFFSALHAELKTLFAGSSVFSVSATLMTFTAVDEHTAIRTVTNRNVHPTMIEIAAIRHH
jgi:hypothetical protein